MVPPNCKVSHSLWQRPRSARGSLYPISVRVSRGVVLMLHYLKRHPPFDTDAGRSELLERLQRIKDWSSAVAWTACRECPSQS
jgi:hypothetical protein